MMPFKDADKHAKVFLEKFMDIVALFLMPFSYITFKALACMIDFMFALSTLTNQARAPSKDLADQIYGWSFSEPCIRPKS